MDQRVIDTYQAALALHKPEFIIGIDEVGWGCIAGTLVLGCVVYKPDFSHPKVKDSKAFTTERSREAGLEVVRNTSPYVDTHVTSVQAISSLGASAVLHAAMFTLATKAIAHYPNSLVVIDGSKPIKGLNHPQLALEKGDGYVAAVSAASMVAKVTRDKYMSEISKNYPEYEWHNNKGYPTDKHVRMLNQHGVSEHHRLNIALVREALKKHGTYEENHCVGLEE